MDFLFGREDVAGKDSVFFLILTSILYLGFILYLLYLYFRIRERASIASSDLTDLWALGLPFWLDFLPTDRTDAGTSGHFDRPCGPVNFWVVFFQSGESKYKVLFPNAGDCKYNSFVMSIILEYQLHHLSNWAFLVWWFIDIIDWNRSGELTSVDLFSFYKLWVNKQAWSSTV